MHVATQGEHHRVLASLSDGLERSTAFPPGVLDKQGAGQTQTIGSIEGGARAREFLTTGRGKGSMLRPRREGRASHCSTLRDAPV